MTPINSAMRITPPFSDPRHARKRAPTAGKRGPAIGLVGFCAPAISTRRSTCFRGDPLATARMMLAHAADRAGPAHSVLEVAVNLRILVLIIDLRAALLDARVRRALGVG